MCAPVFFCYQKTGVAWTTAAVPLTCSHWHKIPGWGKSESGLPESDRREHPILLWHHEIFLLHLSAVLCWNRYSHSWVFSLGPLKGIKFCKPHIFDWLKLHVQGSTRSRLNPPYSWCSCTKSGSTMVFMADWNKQLGRFYLPFDGEVHLLAFPQPRGSIRSSQLALSAAQPILLKIDFYPPEFEKKGKTFAFQ